MISPVTRHNGILLIDKQEGETSFDIVHRMRKRCGIKKVGHAGTLDPFATGLLILLIGQGTRLFPDLMTGRKRYVANLRLGMETDTLDTSGCIRALRSVPKDIERRVTEEVGYFVGEIDQTPPQYSAVKHKGKRAYSFARSGITVPLPQRKVTVFSLDILSIDIPEITIEVCCSSGTYIRSLGADIGHRVGTGACLSALRRLSSGLFDVEDALRSDRIGSTPVEELFSQWVISLNDALPHMKSLQIDTEQARKVRNGQKPDWGEMIHETIFTHEFPIYCKLVKESELIAIVEVDRLSSLGNPWMKKIRVFHSDDH